MTIQRMMELLEIEHECMLRVSHDDCDRNCADCELVQDDGDLHEMYTNVIALLKKQEVFQINRFGIGADEKISIEFTGAEFDEILKYQESVGATTVQNAVMNAISIAFDNSEWK